MPLIFTRLHQGAIVSGGAVGAAGWRRPAAWHTSADGLITHHGTTYKHQLLDLTKAQGEPKVQPHAMVDDLDRVAVALVRCRCGAHPTDPSRAPTLTNVTVPSRKLSVNRKYNQTPWSMISTG
jgi:hypothetical protein